MNSAIKCFYKMLLFAAVNNGWWNSSATDQIENSLIDFKCMHLFPLCFWQFFKGVIVGNSILQLRMKCSCWSCLGYFLFHFRVNVMTFIQKVVVYSWSLSMSTPRLLATFHCTTISHLATWDSLAGFCDIVQECCLGMTSLWLGLWIYVNQILWIVINL